MKKIIVVGGVAGGATFAARMRRLDEEAQIVLIERGPYISYANCGLPYYIGDVIKNRDSLLVTTEETMRTRFNIDVRTRHEVTAIDRQARTVQVRDLETGREYTETYDELVLSTGSSPLRPPIPGIDSPLVRTLWTVPDTDAIASLLRDRKLQSAAVIGGGFIGLETAENLRRAGLDVTLIEGSPQVMPPLDGEMAKLVQQNILEHGVHLILDDPVASFEEVDGAAGKQVTITTKSGRKVTAAFVLLSIGTRANSQLAADAGLEMADRGGVVTDACMRSSDPHIFVVGDIAQTADPILGGSHRIQLAGPANKEGRIAADVLAGLDHTYTGSVGTSVAQVFDLEVAMTGSGEKGLIRTGLVRGKDYEVVTITQNSHAGYYPGAVPMTLKLLFAADGSRIFGAQIVGRGGCDKRIDVIATAMQLGAKATDLARLELAYAPPFSSAKDPVNMAGFAVQNVLEGLTRFAPWDALESAGKPLQILDVREPAEVQAAPLPGAKNIPLGQLRSCLGQLDPQAPTLVFCAIGVRGHSGARILSQHGFKDVAVYPGGARFYFSTHYKEDDIIPIDDPKPAILETIPAKQESQSGNVRRVTLNCSGMQCPGPLMKVFDAMNDMADGDMLEVTASDPGFARDIIAWCRTTGNTLVSNEKKNGAYVARVRKGKEAADLPAAAEAPAAPAPSREGLTMVVFSGDMDKVMAGFVIANGAAAMGKPVTMFFTFWGLTALRKKHAPQVDKTKMEAAFGAMLPKGVRDLSISRMNMGGLGTAMMKKIMKDKNVNSLQDLLFSARKNGVKLVACTMSMDVMGIRKEELIDGVELGGVGTYLGDADSVNVNLFI
jgi:NADPH-dependent 2,4-dienoyl-CoA reductase/sulfur reductase-like enzyme/peroxiredoxin family protein/TusA-related sulfurtransferase/rhodanese-related sulfurtransferase